jgi:hypothetical protein
MYQWRQNNALRPLISLAHVTFPDQTRRIDGRAAAEGRSCTVLPLSAPHNESPLLPIGFLD